MTMQLTMLKAKIHRATVTDADLNYHGSITIAPELLEASGILPHEKVEIYNCNTGARFATYVIVGGPGDICVNGAAARLVQRGDVVIIVAYAHLDADEAAHHQPTVVFVNEDNSIAEIKRG
jgi:aspartate 1-decarboxylase